MQFTLQIEAAVHSHKYMWGRRNGFSKVVPWFGGPWLHGGAGGLHGGAPGVPKFLPRPKNILGKPYKQLEVISISHMSQITLRLFLSGNLRTKIP